MGAGEPAIPGGILQRAQPVELRNAKRDRVFKRRNQRVRGVYHGHGDDLEADSIRVEAVLLNAAFTSTWRPI
jgi:hypothetical protein